MAGVSTDVCNKQTKYTENKVAHTYCVRIHVKNSGNLARFQVGQLRLDKVVAEVLNGRQLKKIEEKSLRFKV